MKTDKITDTVYEVHSVVTDILSDMERGKITPKEALQQMKAECKSIDLRKAKECKDGKVKIIKL